MKAVLCRAFGPPDTLSVADIAEPVAGPGEVVVRVRAIGLNFFDLLILEDKYQLKPALPFSPGGELAGEVDSLGSDCDWAKPGDRVIALSRYGAAREKVVVAESDLIAIPDELSFELAASLTITYGTTLHALADRGELKPGETIAILGASGGVGQAAIEVAKLMGARVIACASSPEKLAFCRDKGADEFIDYSREDLKARLKQLTDGIGVDVVYDAVGDKYAEPAIRALAWRGRHLVVGFAGGEIPKIPLNLLLLKGADIRGVFWGEFVAREPEAYADLIRQLMDWAVRGALKPHIHASYPLERTGEALAALASRRVVGKIIVTP
ncbi:MAG: NADPH:quinone oxidoreductase family protein [Ancalomicrobiaceae bacterium]|nr:NADPH:quinone oxidoreductase family protein [Ancalomicrobiaceae bacterium]